MSSATRATEVTTGWRPADVREVIRETPSAATLVLDVAGWPGHRAGQHVDQLELRGPVGGWFVWRATDGGPLFLVAGGSGLVPLMAMLRHRARAGSDAEVRLLLSARSEQDVLYAGELRELVDPAITYTREAPAGWTGYARRVDRDMLTEAGFPPEERPRVFVCGPTGFVEGVARELLALGHDPARIRTERFGATGG